VDAACCCWYELRGVCVYALRYTRCRDGEVRGSGRVESDIYLSHPNVGRHGCHWIVMSFREGSGGCWNRRVAVT
jgi:hypothetical protein